VPRRMAVSAVPYAFPGILIIDGGVGFAHASPSVLPLRVRWVLSDLI